MKIDPTEGNAIIAKACGITAEPCPDYFNDIQAIHEAHVTLLTNNPRYKYYYAVIMSMFNGNMGGVMTALPEQRARALVLTLKREYGLNLYEFTPGTRIRYIPGVAQGNPNDTSCEDGTVSSVNDLYVFVKFDKQVEKLGWDGTTSQSCDPKDLIIL